MQGESVDKKAMLHPSIQNVRTCLRSVITNLADDTRVDLFERGQVDSLSLIEMVVALERAFAINFEPGDMKIQNFSTLEEVAKTVEHIQKRKRR